LANQVADRKPGDQLLFTTTTMSDFYQERDGRRVIPSLLDDSETETAELSGASKLGLRLKTPLQHEHQALGKFRGEVANLSRNVIVESADPQGVRGHTAYHHGSTGSISYAEFRHLGKEGVLGRYPIHFHLCGDTMRGSSVTGVSVWDSANRWITLHGTNFILVRDCIGYRSTGHGFFFEDGTEVNNVLDHNLAVQALMGKPLPKQMLPFDTNDGAGFWWANCGNSFTRNVAVDCGKFGYRFQMTRTPDFSPELSVLNAKGDREKTDVRTIPFVRFDGNEAHSQRRFAFNLGGFHGQSETADLDRDGHVIDRGAYLGGDVQGIGPDFQHPFEIKNYLVWGSHWGFHTAAPNVRIQGFTAHDVNYVFWRSNLAGNDYNGLDCTDIHVSTFFNGWGASADREAQLRYVEPVDDTPPVTLITGWQWLKDERVKIRGVAVDGGSVRQVKVNGEEATLIPGPVSDWSITLLAKDGRLDFEAQAFDEAGNAELNRQHQVITRGSRPTQLAPTATSAPEPAIVTLNLPVPTATLREALIDPKNLPWPLWDGSESAADYAKRVHLPATRTLQLGDTPLELVLVPAASYVMGSSSGSDSDEQPPHRVVISKPYYLGKYELTQRQYAAVTGSHPSYFRGPDRPVEQVSWLDTQAFLSKAGQGLRLPTEAEWEFASRAGTGDSLKPDQLSKIAWWGHSVTEYAGNAPDGTGDVGGREPNAFGLHDMLGNVYEWCADTYAPDYYSSSPVLDPQGSAAAEEKVLRGGSWESSAAHCRPANRNGFSQQSRGYLLGFRVAAPVPDK
ncbi:MAG: hypothetical protein JWO82_969, partial [Akkermansiaceae bacterium]|nr:hypothetical protein [Akkermansiaceae bacterium]